MKTLIDCMETLRASHEQLLALCFDKVETVKAGDMNGLSAIVREEMKLISKIDIYEQVRQKTVSALIAEKGLAAEEATLHDLLAFATAEERTELEQIEEQLIVTIERLSAENERNRELIEHSLEFVQLSLDLLVPQKEDISYSRNQDEDHDPLYTGHSLFDSKA